MQITIILLCLAVLSSTQFAYDEELAKELGALAFASYCPTTAIESWSTGYVSLNYPDLVKIQVFENTDLGTKGYIAYNKKLNAITIVFRGSENFMNWIEDITFTKTQFNTVCNCKVHQGFHAAYTSLKLLADAMLPEYRVRYPYAVFHVAGHSLGGAMATMFAADLSTVGFKVTLVTLGSPRVGDAAFYDWIETLKISHSRIVHEKDYAPHMPPMTFGFQHINHEIWYTGDGYIVCQDVKGEDRACSYSVKNPVMSDHSTYLGWTVNVDC